MRITNTQKKIAVAGGASVATLVAVLLMTATFTQEEASAPVAAPVPEVIENSGTPDERSGEAAEEGQGNEVPEAPAQAPTPHPPQERPESPSDPDAKPTDTAFAATSFDETEEVAEPAVEVEIEPVEMVAGFRITAHGHVLGAMPELPARTLHRGGTLDRSLLRERDVSAGFSHNVGELAVWNAGKVAFQHADALVTIPAGPTSADDLAALMTALEGGNARIPESGGSVADLDQLEYAVYSVSATGLLEIEDDGVYEFRVVHEPRRRGREINVWQKAEADIHDGHELVVVEVAGQLAFGGAAATIEKDGWAKHIVGNPLHLSPGSYPISFRASPALYWGWQDRFRFTVEMRRPGVHGWLDLGDLVKSPKVPVDTPQKLPIRDIRVTHAGARDDKCPISTLPDAFINPQTGPRHGHGQVEPVPGCQLVTVSATLDAPVAGDYFLLPYISRGKRAGMYGRHPRDFYQCGVAMDYVANSVSAREQAIPSPALKDSGRSFIYASENSGYGHIRVKEPGPVEIEIRAMCHGPSEFTLFMKTPETSRMLPW